MNEQTLVRTQAVPSSTFTPARSGLLQRRAVGQDRPPAVPPIVHEVLGSPGEPLDAATRAFMEPRFGYDFGSVRVHEATPGVTQTKLSIGRPGDQYEQEANRVSERVMRGPRAEMLDVRSPESVASTRVSMEPRSGYDFGRVRVHTDARAAESARAMNALAYTVGQDIVFAAGQYAPERAAGKRLLAHELTHVVQQSSSLGARVQAFTAELGEERKVFIKPEKGDTDADLDRVLCPAIKDRKIAKREKIDVTACLPKGIVRAMKMGPYICGQFVRFALAGEKEPLNLNDLESAITTVLWKDLLKSGYRIAGFGYVNKEGKLEPVKTETPMSWKQLNPKMGDLVFMIGSIRLNKGAKEPDPAGDNFSVNWDHVGFFIVRSRKGFDYHLAKDGDENPIDVYHTGMKLDPEQGLMPGAYVKGAHTLVAYLRVPEPESKAKEPEKKTPEKKPPKKKGAEKKDPGR